MSDPLFDEWQTYHKLLQYDYMDHAAFFSTLQQAVARRFDHPIRILDLGCGDTTPIRQLLKEQAVEKYCGLDESLTALDKAAAHLETAGLDFRLAQADLAGPWPSFDRPFDLVVASFSLHHLPDPAQKQAVLERCRGMLADDGVMAVIDVFCDPGERREQYLSRWVDNARRRYQALLPGEIEQLVAHVRERDYPESLPGYRNMAQAVGYSGFELLFEDADELNRLVLLAA